MRCSLELSKFTTCNYTWQALDQRFLLFVTSCSQDLLTAMRLALAAAQPWVLMNGALAAWNAYVPLLHKQRYSELAGVLLPVLKLLLQVE